MIVKEAIKHSLQRTLSVVCVLLVVGGLCWAIYVAFVKPNTDPNATTTQNAEQIDNVYYYAQEESFFFGVRIFGLKFGITKNKVVKQDDLVSNINE